MPASSRRPRRTIRRRRANRVVEVRAALAAGLAGAFAALDAPAATAHPVIDVGLVSAGVAMAVYAAASAPWWALVVAALAATTVAGTPLLAIVALTGCAVALVIGWRRRSMPDGRALSAALTLNVLVRAEVGAPFGVTAIVAVAAAGLLVVFGLRRRSTRIRRIAAVVVGAVAGFVVLAAAGFLVEAFRSRADLADGRREALLAVDAVERGEYEAAATHFQTAESLLSSAAERLDKPWVSLAAAVPIVAQHRDAVVSLSRGGADVAATAAEAAVLADPARLRVIDGVIDLDAVRALAAPVDALHASVDRLAAVVADADSRWLLPVVGDELAELSAQLDENMTLLDDVSSAVALAPQLLGGDGARTYLVLFTTPAEARGLGGFIGNYAELTVDAGAIELTDFGRVSDLEARGREVGVRISGADEFLARYGTFGYNTDGDGLVGSAAWRNLTMSPDFPTVAAVAAEMYPQVTGRNVDGVVAVDPYVLAMLLSYTGPIELPSAGFTIDAENGAEYILIGQYLNPDHVGRIDALDEAARATLDRLLSGSLPAPNTLAHDLGPLAAERRLALWTPDVDEQDLLRRVGLLDEIPRLDGADGWAVTVTNAAGSKIDTFLERRVSYDATTDDGVTSGTLRLELVNTAPSTGLPDYVIGNELDLPTGTSRLYVSFYSALMLESATLDGEPIRLAASTEAGWNVYSGYVALSSGEHASLELQLRGTVTNPSQVVTWTQPLVIDAVVE